MFLLQEKEPGRRDSLRMNETAVIFLGGTLLLLFLSMATSGKTLHLGICPKQRSQALRESSEGLLVSGMMLPSTCALAGCCQARRG